MSSSPQTSPEPPPKTRAARAEFKVAETKVKLEKIPELEQAGKKAKPIAPQPSTTQAQASTQPPHFTPEAFRGYLMLAFDKYNQALDAPLTGDPKARYRLDKNDADGLIKVTEALDAKYHFMGRWVEYFPEIMAVIVIAGILGKVAMGMQYKNKEAQMQKGAAGPQANVEAKAPASNPPVSSGPSPFDRIKKGIDDWRARVQNPGEGPPRELVEDAMNYFQTQKARGATT